jgi:hypothetical protein
MKKPITLIYATLFGTAGVFLAIPPATRVRIWSSPVLQTMPDENRLLSYIRSQMKLNDRFGPR